MIFAYCCSSCEEQIEHDARIGEAPAEVDCPACGGTAFRDFSMESKELMPVWRGYVSNRLPRNMPGEETDDTGKVVVGTQQDERRIAAKLGWARDADRDVEGGEIGKSDHAPRDPKRDPS